MIALSTHSGDGSPGDWRHGSDWSTIGAMAICRIRFDVK